MSDSPNAIAWERKDDVIVVRFTRDQVKGDEYTIRASDELKKLALDVGGKVVFSLSNVRFLSSAGIAALILFNKLVRLVRGQLKFCEIQPLIRQVFTAGGFEKAFDIHETMEEAIDAFQ